MNKNKIWNKNFCLIVMGTALSAIGSVGLSTAMSIIVFSETTSTLLSAFFLVLGYIPEFIVPLFAGSMIDRKNPLKVLLKNEMVLAVCFFIAAIVTNKIGFNYFFYLLFSVVISGLGVISQLSSSSVQAQAIKKENYIQANAVLSILYPLCKVFVAPISIFLFEQFGIPVILFAYGVLTLLDIGIESLIKHSFEYKEAEAFSFKLYIEDLKSGIYYFWQDEALRSVFIFFSIVMFADAAESLIYPFFNQSANLNNSDYALLMSVRSAGYMLGGFFHYFVTIPNQKRYQIAIIVYFAFVLFDGVLLFLPYIIMLIVVFVLGFLGVNSANIRSSSVATRVDNHYRAKVNSIFYILISFSSSIAQLLCGILAEFIPYTTLRIFFSFIYFCGIIFFVLPKKNKVKELYNFDTETV